MLCVNYLLMQLHAILSCEVLCLLNLPLSIFYKCCGSSDHKKILLDTDMYMCFPKDQTVLQTDINQSVATRFLEFLQFKEISKNYPSCFITNPHSISNPFDFGACSACAAVPEASPGPGTEYLHTSSSCKVLSAPLKTTDFQCSAA